MSDELESARICAIETELAAVHEAHDRVAAERDSLRAELDQRESEMDIQFYRIKELEAKLAEAVETWARNADSYLSLEAEVKTLNRMLDAEKEARQRAEKEANEAEETSRDLAVSLGRLVAEFATEKEARQGADKLLADYERIAEESYDHRLTADRERDAALADANVTRVRLLAIEREARALLLALDVEPRSYGVTAALRAALGAK